MSAGQQFSLWLRHDRRHQLEQLAEDGETVADKINQALQKTFGTPPPLPPSPDEPADG